MAEAAPPTPAGEEPRTVTCGSCQRVEQEIRARDTHWSIAHYGEKLSVLCDQCLDDLTAAE